MVKALWSGWAVSGRLFCSRVFLYTMFWRVCIRDESGSEYIACLFVCTVVQRRAPSPQLCHSLLSNAKQEINVACCVCFCMCVCASPDTSGCQCFSLGRVCVCVYVWSERERKKKRCVCPQAKGKRMPGKAGQCHPSLPVLYSPSPNQCPGSV